MSTSTAETHPLAVTVHYEGARLHVTLADGRIITAPLTSFPRLQGAPPSALEKWQLIGGGIGIHWRELDEDVSIAGLLAAL